MTGNYAYGSAALEPEDSPGATEPTENDSLLHMVEAMAAQETEQGRPLTAREYAALDARFQPGADLIGLRIADGEAPAEPCPRCEAIKGLCRSCAEALSATADYYERRASA